MKIKTAVIVTVLVFCIANVFAQEPPPPEEIKEKTTSGQTKPPPKKPSEKESDKPQTNENGKDKPFPRIEFKMMIVFPFSIKENEKTKLHLQQVEAKVRRLEEYNKI